MFIRKINGTNHKEARVYNCNWFTASVRVIEDYRRLTNVAVGVYHSALHRRQNDPDKGICGALSWGEIVLHFKANRMPFNRNVTLYDLRNHESIIN